MYVYYLDYLTIYQYLSILNMFICEQKYERDVPTAMREGAYVFVHMIPPSKISCRASLQLPVTDVKVRSWFISKICGIIAICL